MRNNLAIATAVAIVAAAAFPVSLVYLENGAVYAAVICLAALVTVLVLAFRNAANASSKITLMLEAIRNNDFSMRFHDRNNRAVNRALEKISAIIREDKQNARRNERYYGLIMEKVNAGIFAADENGCVEICNDKMLELLGVNVFTHLEQLEKIDVRLKDELFGMQPGEIKMLSYKMENGGGEISASRSRISFEKKVLDIFVLNNIYHVINSNEVEAWVKLTRVLTHEIMNGIAPINSLCGQLQDCTDREKLREGLETIQNTSSSLIRFTEDYRKFAAIPAPVCRLFSVREFLERIILLFKGCGAEFAVEVLPAELIVNADKALIERVVVNLLKNSMESGASHVKVRAGCINELEQVAIDVSDDGQPVCDDIKDQIFVPFFTTKENGSGIGLPVSRRIMSMHNGSLQLIRPSSRQYGFSDNVRQPVYTKTFRLIFP